MSKIASVLLFFVVFSNSYSFCQTSPPPLGGARPGFYIQEAQKIKIGETTEAEVIAILGQPSSRSGMESVRKGTVQVERLFYGPTASGHYAVVIVIDKGTGKVFNMRILPKP